MAPRGKSPTAPRRSLSDVLTVVVAVALLMLLPGLARALGLGPLSVQSRLNQPLEARVPLRAVNAGELDRMQVSLADAETLARAGILRSAQLLDLRFELVATPEPHVRVYSREAVREPALEFIVDVAWPGGHAQRRYGVLLKGPE